MYARISSDPNDTALGGKRQIKDCQALAEARGWTVGEVFTDNDVSATRAKPRPAPPGPARPGPARPMSR